MDATVMSQLLLPRRSFLTGLASLFAAPAIVRASSLMQIKSSIIQPNRNALLIINEITKSAVQLFKTTNIYLTDELPVRFDRIIRVSLPNDYDK